MLIGGAGGFAIQLYDVLCQLEANAELAFFDDCNPNSPRLFAAKHPILRSSEDVLRYFREVDVRFALGTGNPQLRRKLFDKFSALGGRPTTVISPHAIIGNYDVAIGEAVAILSAAIVESTVSIGSGTLINLNATITHATRIGEFCEVGPGVRVSGGCLIGQNVFIGTGAIILPGITIGDNSRIGAGAVVTRNVPANTTVKGVPAK